MYDDPSLLVLDEPNSNLDDVGEQALVVAINDLRQRGKTIVLITHRTTILGATTKLLLLRDGVAQAFGPRDQVLAALNQANQQAQQQAQQAQQQAAAQQAAQQAQMPAGLQTAASEPPADTQARVEASAKEQADATAEQE
jgi:ATP-binding cassette subfamily C exporter for protease/lipase